MSHMWTTPTRLFQNVPAPKIITWHHIAIFEVWSLPPAHTFFDHHTCALIALIHLSGIVFANGYWVTSFQDLGTINVCSSMVFLMCELSILLEVSQATSRHQTSTGSVFCDPAGVVWNWLRRHHESAGNNRTQISSQLGAGAVPWSPSAGYRDEQLISRQGHGLQRWKTSLGVWKLLLLPAHRNLICASCISDDPPLLSLHFIHLHPQVFRNHISYPQHFRVSHTGGSPSPQSQPHFVLSNRGVHLGHEATASPPPHHQLDKRSRRGCNHPATVPPPRCAGNRLVGISWKFPYGLKWFLWNLCIPIPKKKHMEENPSIVRQFHRYSRFSSVESQKKTLKPYNPVHN